ILLIRRHDNGYGPAENFRGRITIEPFGPLIPTRDRTVQVFADNRVIGGFDNRCQTRARFLGAFLFGYVPRGGENTDHRTGLIPVHRGVIEYGRDLSIPEADLEVIVTDGFFGEDPLVSLSCFFRVGEIAGEVSPDELLSCKAGDKLGRGVDIADLSFPADSD